VAKSLNGLICSAANELACAYLTGGSSTLARVAKTALKGYTKAQLLKYGRRVARKVVQVMSNEYGPTVHVDLSRDAVALYAQLCTASLLFKLSIFVAENHQGPHRRRGLRPFERS
jgi:hypothetical protein